MSIASFLIAIAAGLGSAGADGFRPLDLDGAIAAARVEDRPILVSFQSPGSADSRKLDSTTWVESKVRDWLRARVVAIKVDAEEQPELATRFRVHSLPTIVLCNRQGIELDRITGYVDGRTFRPQADAILGGGDPLERARKRMAGREDDPHARIDLAGALSDSGQHAEALQQYMWCWDHGLEHDPEFGHTRAGFLLGQVVRLGRFYTPAVDELMRRGAELGARVRDCTASEGVLGDFLALAKALQRDDTVLAAYDGIADTGDECAPIKAALVPHVIDPLIDVRRYEEAVVLIGDVDERARVLVAACDADLRRFVKEKRGALAIEQRRLRLRAALARLYEALLGAEEYDEADALARHVILLDGAGATYSALLRGALRAKAHGAARSIALRAYGDARLSDADKLEIKSIARDILVPR